MTIRASFLDKRGLSSSTLANSKTKGCDLKNRVVTAITFEEVPHVVYNQSCIDRLPVSNSSYFELTHCITGWLVDIFHVLEKHCNFELRVKALKRNIPFGDVGKKRMEVTIQLVCLMKFNTLIVFLLQLSSLKIEQKL